MADHTGTALLAAARALDEVVAPALDGRNPLAAEQLRLVSGVLAFVEQRVDYHYARSRFELLHYLRVAGTLRQHADACPPIIADALKRATAAASRLEADRCARTQDLHAATADLAAAISALVRAAGRADGTTARHVHAVVTAASRDFVDAQRAWFLPQGFEADPARLPSIDTALHGPARTTTTSEEHA